MLPNLEIGGRIITPYMICALAGMFAAGILAMKSVGRERENTCLTVLLWSSIGVIAGGSFLYALTNLPLFLLAIRQESADIWQVLILTFGGSVFYGGLFGGLLAGRIYCAVSHTDSAPYCDAAALFIPLFHTFGRIGCFLSGCCYGMASDFGFICRYSLVESANGIRRFPVQLLESCGNLLIFLLIFYLWKYGRMQNQRLRIYLTLYAVLRFFTEFLRGDAYRGIWLGLSTSQWISLTVLLVLALIRFFSRNGECHGTPTDESYGTAPTKICKKRSK